MVSCKNYIEFFTIIDANDCLISLNLRLGFILWFSLKLLIDKNGEWEKVLKASKEILRK